MGTRSSGGRMVGISLVVLLWSSASGSRADDALVGEPGPIRQSIAQRDDLRAQVRIDPLPLGTRRLRPNHAKEGAIAGAVVGGAMGGLFFLGVGALACESHSGGCGEAWLLGAAGATGGAFVGGAVGALIGSLFQTAPSIRAAPSGDRTRLSVLPSRRGIGVALVHSF